VDAVFRAAVIYLFLLLMIRLTGNRPLSQVTVFDLVLLIVIGESTQQALIGDNFSVVNAVVLIATLVFLEVVLDRWSKRSRWVSRLAEGEPVVLIADGRVLADRLRACGVDTSDVMQAARSTHGLERLEQIRYAVMEKDGSISVIPRR
jgi:uncharacterized membrane protein YcaP (DUF421 family)